MRSYTANVMRFVVLFVLVALASAKPMTFNKGNPALKPLTQEMVDYVNAQQTTWRAAMSDRFLGLTEDDARRLCGTYPRTGGTKLPVTDIKIRDDVPDTFDARTHWPNCPTISDIRDQGACGSCWALSAAEAMSDRYCIKYQENVNISAEDLLTCCDICAFLDYSGCQGGMHGMAWEFWNYTWDFLNSPAYESGVVTGGQFGSNKGCQPYTIPQCDHMEPGPYPNCSGSAGALSTPQCVKSCISGYPKSYQDDKHYGESVYGVSGAQLQTEIMTHGPVDAAFDVYGDFLTYRSGVYQHIGGYTLGSHAVKILGWGTENNTPYWLVANSWNTYWGDNGYFKILRGQNECGIESSVFAGEPMKYQG